DGKRVAAAGQGNNVYVLDTETGKPLQTLTTSPAKLVFSLAWPASHDHLLATLDTGEVCLIDLNGTTSAVLGRHGSPATCCAAQAGGDLVASGSGNGLPGGDFGTLSGPSNDNHIRIWNTKTRTPVRDLDTGASAVIALRFDDSGSRLASASADRKVTIWSV